MNNQESLAPYLSIRQIFSERTMRDLILFVSLFLFTISQEWNNFLLLLFPLMTFLIGFFFRLVDENKWRTKFQDSPVSYSPLGSERKHANRFIFSALLLQIFLFWIGAESLYHPQLIDNYSVFFVILFIFIYNFTFFWIFIDIWKYCQIKVEIERGTEELTRKVEVYDNLIEFLDINFFKHITYISLYSFLALTFLNLILTLFTYFGGMPGFSYDLPGSGLESSPPLYLHYFVFLILIASPFITVLLLYLVYRNINQIKPDKLFELLDKVPKNLRLLILEQLRMLNKKLLKESNLE
ncbi:MAG: conserved membrane protein of unknown function [Promethearchaeota archaeon]|nr:MAG: conserved membrane protein of unknown function [Candidatus Lokiarchaeota archaeon]